LTSVATATASAPASAIASVVSVTRAGVITATGHPGHVTLGRSDEAAVKQFWGKPAQVLLSSGHAGLLFYDCTRRPVRCFINFSFAPGGTLAQLGDGTWVLLNTDSVTSNPIRPVTRTNHASGGVIGHMFTIAARTPGGLNPTADGCGNY
jgi:hypothetical protein